MIRIAAATALLVAAGATTAAAPTQNGATRRVERTLAGLKPGAPQRCLYRDRVSEIRTAEGVIVYVAGKNRVWRNNVVGQGCFGLKRGDIVITESTSGAYCRGDIVRTRAPLGGGGGSCSLGDFIPYTK